MIETMAAMLAIGQWPDGRYVALMRRDEPFIFLSLYGRFIIANPKDVDKAAQRAIEIRREMSHERA